MKFLQLLSVINQNAALACSNEQPPGTKRQDRRDGSSARVGRKNLAEAEPVECQNTFCRGHNQQLRLVHVPQDARCQAQQRRGRQLLAWTVMLDQGPMIVIAKQSRSAAQIEFAFKNSRSGKCFRRADPFKAAVDASQLADREVQELLRMYFHSGKAQGPLSAPERKSCTAHGQE